MANELILIFDDNDQNRGSRATFSSSQVSARSKPPAESKGSRSPSSSAPISS